MSAVQHEKITVAVVDDDRASRDSVCAVIQSIGYSTEAFESGESFLNNCDLTRPNCLVVDYRLPGMSGLDLQEQLRNNRIHVPIILISGYADVKIAVTAMQQGAVTLLQKPYNQEDLLKSVKQGVTLNIEQRERRERADAAKQRLSQLNAKEKEVLQQMLQGKSNKAVAQALGIGLRTVERRRHDIFSKTSVDSEVKLAELVQQAQSDDFSGA